MAAKPRITAAVVGTALAGTLAAYVATLETPEPAALQVDLEQAATDDPGLVPLVKAACPECRVTVACAMRDDGFLCRHGLLYGPGLGGVNADGSPATCTVRAQDTPWPCTGPDAGWPETVRALVVANDHAKILDEIDRRVKERPAPQGGGQ